MSNLSGFRQANPFELAQAIVDGDEQEKNDQQAKGSRQKIKAQAFAKVCAMFNTTFNEMTPSQVAYAEAVEKRMVGDVTSGKGFGFSLPDVHLRRPNIR